MAPQSSCTLDSVDFDSPLSYQSLPYPFPLTQEVALSWTLFPSSPEVSLLPGGALGVPVVLGHLRTAQGSLKEPDFGEAFLCPVWVQTAPGALSKDSWIRHLHIHLSRVAGIFWVHLYLSPPAEGSFLACLISQWLFFSLKSSGGEGLGPHPSPWSGTQGRMQELEHSLRLLPLLPWEERVHHSI